MSAQPSKATFCNFFRNLDVTFSLFKLFIYLQASKTSQFNYLYYEEERRYYTRINRINIQFMY
ncbi:MAG: hypothetical protein ACJA0U_003157 [Salibacteraceae bacterium]|jgi:hypothetical protein